MMQHIILPCYFNFNPHFQRWLHVYFQELQLISQVKDTLIDTLNQAKAQLVNSREAKHRLEMDWSDKVRIYMK